MNITELKNKRSLYWGGYKNTTIPKMTVLAYDQYGNVIGGGEVHILD